MYQRLAPITRAAKRAAQSEPIIREEFEAGRLVLRRSFLDHFAEEFAPLGSADRTRAVLTAELAFQFEAFEFLWNSTNGQVTEMRTILIDHLTMCLGRLERVDGVLNRPAVESQVIACGRPRDGID